MTRLHIGEADRLSAIVRNVQTENDVASDREYPVLDVRMHDSRASAFGQPVASRLRQQRIVVEHEVVDIVFVDIRFLHDGMDVLGLGPIRVRCGPERMERIPAIRTGPDPSPYEAMALRPSRLVARSCITSPTIRVIDVEDDVRSGSDAVALEDGAPDDELRFVVGIRWQGVDGKQWRIPVFVDGLTPFARTADVPTDGSRRCPPVAGLCIARRQDDREDDGEKDRMHHDGVPV